MTVDATPGQGIGGSFWFAQMERQETRFNGEGESGLLAIYRSTIHFDVVDDPIQGGLGRREVCDCV